MVVMVMVKMTTTTTLEKKYEKVIENPEWKLSVIDVKKAGDTEPKILSKLLKMA